jgi:uncharacterized protein (TIGR02186 family)
MRPRRSLIPLAVLLALVVDAASASAESLVFALINSSFTGAELVLFGTVESDGAVRPRPSYDLVVTVIGPKQDVVTRRKERVLGIWVNADSRTFAQSPTYLAVLSNRDLEQIADAETRRRLQIGLANTVLSGDSDAVNNDPFRVALLRLNLDHGLYRENTKAVTFLTPNLFRAEIKLPSNVPIGVYKVEVRLFFEGQQLTLRDSYLEIVKVGFEQFVATESRDHGLRYGLATVALAILTGWLAAFVFKKD